MMYFTLQHQMVNWEDLRRNSQQDSMRTLKVQLAGTYQQ
jgi:hypothetical protein